MNNEGNNDNLNNTANQSFAATNTTTAAGPRGANNDSKSKSVIKSYPSGLSSSVSRRRGPSNVSIGGEQRYCFERSATGKMHSRRSSAGGGSEDDGERFGSSEGNKSAKPTTCSRLMESLSQQKLKAWQPVLTPNCASTIFLISGVLFIGMGIMLILVNQRVVECQLEYGDPDNICEDIAACTKIISASLTPEACVGLYGKDFIEPPVYLYYRLTKYYQNHRRYVKSRNDRQLEGTPITESNSLASCDPLIFDPVASFDRKILSPCGLIAYSVFNDTYAIQNSDGSPVTLDDSASTIAWSSDIPKFKNPNPPPDPSLVKEWLSETIFPGKVENGRFIGWMRASALPDFRKLYAKIDTKLTFPLTIVLSSRYPVAPFDGKKYIVLSQMSFLGGRNMFLGIAYEVMGSLCVLFGLIFILKNCQKPRLMGDVRHLNRIFNRQGKKLGA